jgi:XisI protein
MENIEKHKKIVKEIIEEIAAMIPDSEPIETQTITDDVHGHYLLTAVGWLKNDFRELNSFVHLDIKPDGKIWIQHDGTDLKIALMLVERGVAKSDIVLAFHTPSRREMIPEFAVN